MLSVGTSLGSVVLITPFTNHVPLHEHHVTTCSTIDVELNDRSCTYDAGQHKELASFNSIMATPLMTKAIRSTLKQRGLSSQNSTIVNAMRC